jgi:hypothetical protein
MRAIIQAAGLFLFLSALPVWAAEPILGRWLLVSQALDGQKSKVDELTLRIVMRGQTLEFGYSVPVNNIQFVSLRFAVHPDGSEGDVTNANGQKMGTVKVTKVSPLQYKILLQGKDRPLAPGTMTVSADHKTLTSESESKRPGQTTVTRLVQIFARQ